MIHVGGTICSLILLALVACAGGCSVQYLVVDGKTGHPSEVVRSGWTNSGCIENLHKTAASYGLTVRLVRVEFETVFGLFGVFPNPYYPTFICHGEVIPQVDEGLDSSTPADQTP